MGGIGAGTGTSTTRSTGDAPPRASLVLTALIISAMVCNINLASANIALPEIGDAFGAGQTALNLVALGCSLGLAMSVLYLGAVADRTGRRRMLVLGLALTIVASAISAVAPTIETLIAARIFTGIAAGMAYPTTLSLITALWAPGPRRTRAIATWSSTSAMASVVGAILAGLLLEAFPWNAAFLLAAPIAAVGLVLVIVSVPAHVAESAEPIDHVGGVLSVFAVAALVLGVSIVFAPGGGVPGIALIGTAIVLVAGFGWRQRVAASPLFDLRIAARRLFWVPAAAGVIVFGSLMGFMFVSAQFVQSILGYGTLEAGLASVPAAVGLLAMIPVSARLVTTSGTRATLLIGYGLVLVGFATTLFWRESTPYWLIGSGFFIIGAGVAIAMTPISRALTSSTPVRRIGMASGTSDLQRDLGGALMQAIVGAILASGFAHAFGRLITASPQASSIPAEVTAALQASYGSALHVAEQYPQYRDSILQAANESFVTGAFGAYLVGGIAVAIGLALVAIGVPSHDRELVLLREYATEDAARAAADGGDVEAGVAPTRRIRHDGAS